MHLDVESLRALVTVLDAGGMTAAADRLGLSQSAVSWKIKRLEQRVGRPLLVRDGRSFRPSRDGAELLDYAATIIDAHDQAVARLSSSELSGHLKLGATEEVCAACVHAVVGRFNRIHPAATIEILVDRSRRLEEMIDRGDIDVAVLQLSPEDLRPDDTVLWTDEQRWIVAADCWFDEGVVPLVTFGETGFYRPLAERILREAGIPYRIMFSGPSAASVIAAVEAGLGVAMLSGRSVTGEVVDWPRAETLPPLPLIHQVARAAAGDRSAVAVELIADIESELAEAETD